MNSLLPRKAEKKRVKLKMAVQGPSGSGKTWGALALAKNLWPDAKVCLIDTENESASLYAGTFDFDTIPLGPPFTTARYVDCIDAVVKGGYDVLIIDTITAQWDGEGGILRRKEELERRSPGVNGYTLWAQFTPEHEAFKQVILQAPLHVICTMRSKQEYALQQNEKGKLTPVKMGLAPIQRDQIDYEFTLVFDVNMMHGCTVSKDRTGLFNEKAVNLADPKTAEAIKGWLDSGVEVVVLGKQAEPIPFPATVAASTPSTKFELQGEEGKEDLLVCVPKSFENRTRVKPGKPGAGPGTPESEPFLKIVLNGVLDGCDTASCFDTALFDLIRDNIGKEFTFHVRRTQSKGKNYVNIDEVFWVDGKSYAAGKPVNMDAEPA